MLRQFKHLCVCVGLVAATGCAQSTNSVFQRSGAERILTEIRQDGASATNQRVGADGRLQDMLAGVASGDSRWLMVAEKIRLGTDASTARALTLALSRALLTNPRGVMGLIDQEYSANHVCSSPYMFPTRAEVERFFPEAIASVEGVNAEQDTELHTTREICLYHLRAAQDMAKSRIRR